MEELKGILIEYVKVMEETYSEEIYEKLVTPCGEKYYADVAGFIEYDLKESGVSKIDRSSACTKCRNDLFFSHRCGDLGRQCGFIMMREDN